MRYQRNEKRIEFACAAHTKKTLSKSLIDFAARTLTKSIKISDGVLKSMIQFHVCP